MVTQLGDKAAVIAANANGRSGEHNEYYQFLVRRLQSMANGMPAPKIVGITSCTHGEGVSTVAGTLAINAARSGDRRVLLIDTKKSPKYLQRKLAGAASAGLTDLLAGHADISECVQPSKVENLSILGAGTTASTFTASFTPAKFEVVLQDLQNKFDFIVLDLPTVSDCTICLSLVASLEGVLLVVEAERVYSQVVRRATKRINESGGQLLGVVLNKCRGRASD